MIPDPKNEIIESASISSDDHGPQQSPMRCCKCTALQDQLTLVYRENALLREAIDSMIGFGKCVESRGKRALYDGKP